MKVSETPQKRTMNPQVARSNRAGRTRKKKGLEVFL